MRRRTLNTDPLSTALGGGQEQVWPLLRVWEEESGPIPQSRLGHPSPTSLSPNRAYLPLPAAAREAASGPTLMALSLLQTVRGHWPLPGSSPSPAHAALCPGSQLDSYTPLKAQVPGPLLSSPEPLRIHSAPQGSACETVLAAAQFILSWAGLLSLLGPSPAAQEAGLWPMGWVQGGPLGDGGLGNPCSPQAPRPLLLSALCAFPYPADLPGSEKALQRGTGGEGPPRWLLLSLPSDRREHRGWLRGCDVPRSPKVSPSLKCALSYWPAERQRLKQPCLPAVVRHSPEPMQQCLPVLGLS